MKNVLRLNISLLVFILAILLTLIVMIASMYKNEKTYNIKYIRFFIRNNECVLYECTDEFDNVYVFSNENILGVNKLNKKDMYKELRRLSGNCNVKITTLGYHIGGTNYYPNIIKIEE